MQQNLEITDVHADYSAHTGIIRNAVNSICFPIRALFMPENGKFGLYSLRDERMSTVASFCSGRILDVGAGPGNLFIKKYIGQNNGVGIDVYPYDKTLTIIEDMSQIPFEDSSFDTITLIAVGGHIPKSKRSDEFKEFSRLLKSGGMIVATEGEPVTQYLAHKWFPLYARLCGKKDMDTERGMAKDEETCMSRKELTSYLDTPPLKFIKRKSFMWGLNNVYIARKQ